MVGSSITLESGAFTLTRALAVHFKKSGPCFIQA